MVYIKKNIKNTLQTLLQGSVSNSDTLFTITTGEGAMFPTNLTPLVVEQFNSSGVCFKREIVNLTGKTGDILTLSRAYESCIQDDTQTPKIYSQNALSFDLNQGVVKISQYNTAKIQNDIQDELILIRNDFIDADLLKANNCSVLTKTANYTFTGTEENNTGFSTSTAGGDVTYTLDLSLFPTDNGLFEFIFCKSTSDTNKVIIDVGSGKNIDNAQTYELTNYWETVTIKVVSSTFAKVVSTSNKPTIASNVQNLTKEGLIAGEAMSALQVYRRGYNTTNYLEQLDESSSQVFLSTNLEVGQSINFQGWLTSFKTKLKRNNSGLAQNLSIQVYSDAGFTNLIGTSNESILATSIPTTFTEYTFTFNNLYVGFGTIYIKIDTNGAGGNTTNNVSVATSTSDVVSGTMYVFNSTGGSPTTIGKDMYYKIYGVLETNNKFYLAKANDVSKLKYEGIVGNNVVSDGTFNGSFEGIVGGFTGLLTGHNIGDLIYLGNDGNIAFSTGTNSVIIGKIFSDTEIEFYNTKYISNKSILEYNVFASTTGTYYTTTYLCDKDTIVNFNGYISYSTSGAGFQVSDDNVNWTTIYTTPAPLGASYNYFNGCLTYLAKAGQYVRGYASAPNDTYKSYARINIQE